MDELDQGENTEEERKGVLMNEIKKNRGKDRGH